MDPLRARPAAPQNAGVMHRRSVPAAAALVWVCVGLAPPALAVSDVHLKLGESTQPNTYAVTVDADVDAPAWAVRSALMHSCDHRERFAYMKECAVFATQGNTAWSYSLVDLPVVSARDYVLVRRVDEDLKPDGTGRMRMRYSHDHNVGPYPRDGVVRVQVNTGYWHIHPVGDGTRTHITYHLEVNPGGSIPVWMARLAARRATPEQLKRIEAIAQHLVKARHKDMPVEGAPWATVKPHPMTLRMRPLPVQPPAAAPALPAQPPASEPKPPAAPAPDAAPTSLPASNAPPG